MSFKDYVIKNEYRSLIDNVVQDFYIPLLNESVSYKRAVGFFSSSALVELSKGITGLIRNNGKIQIVASPYLSPEDIEAILDFACKNLINKINVQFQTNGLLLDDKWLNLFKRFRNIISLSVSFDPPVGDMRRYVTSQTGNYREIVMNNIYKFMGIIENIGVISVCHKYNINGFKNFVCSLKEAGIKNLTINKYRPDIKNINNFYISEAEYVDMLIDLASFWIGQKLYKKINIQPLNSLFAGETNKLCLFKADKDKCFAFRTYFNAAKHYKFCARMADAKVYEMSKECLDCKIFSLCGGGCPVEKKDGTFCEARFKLFNFINFIRSVGDADKKFES